MTATTTAPPRRRADLNATTDDRAAAGRAVRASSPRRSHASWEAAPDREPAMTTLQRQAETFMRAIPFERYPDLLEHRDRHLSDGPHRQVSAFEFGLDLILDGLETAATRSPAG